MSKIRELRVSRSWTQEHLATAAGLNVRTIQRAEASGRAGSETLLAIAAALDVPVATLLSPQAPISFRPILPIADRGSSILAALVAAPALAFVIGNIAADTRPATPVTVALELGAKLPALAVLGGLLASFFIGLAAQFRVASAERGPSALRLELSPAIRTGLVGVCAGLTLAVLLFLITVDQAREGLMAELRAQASGTL